MSVAEFQAALDSILIPDFIGEPDENGWYQDGINPSTKASRAYLADRYEPESAVTTEDFYLALQRGREVAS